MEKQSKVSGTFDTFNSDSKIFSELQNNAPSWWHRLSDPKSNYYVEIRKDNYLNIYYEGGCIVKVRYCSKHKEIQAFTHVRYLGDKKGSSYKNIARELDVKIDMVVRNIHAEYSAKKGEGKEQWSEKYIQSELICRNRTRYIDSEFAYQVSKGKLIRFDLVQLVEGVISVVELKRIDDARMLKMDDKDPEIIEQMTNYSDFLKLHHQEILDYYQKIYDIKVALHLPVPPMRPQSVDLEPQLLIFNRWEKSTQKRKIHIERMEAKLKENRIKYSIINNIIDNPQIISKSFLQREKDRQVGLLKLPLFENAQSGGYTMLPDKKTKKKVAQTFPFILKPEDSIKNLFAPIRKPALEYFDRYKIAWWNASNDHYYPTGQLASSQNHCLNHLFAICRNKDAVLKVINALCDSIQFDKVLPSPLDTKEKEGEETYITFEFTNSNKKLLQERMSTRGANCTSVDALIYAHGKDGKLYLIPIEWKYTEYYYMMSEAKDEVVDRRYRPLVGEGSNLREWIALYNYNPYYEFARQELLMEQIIKHQNEINPSIKVDDFLHVIVCPKQHTELRKAIDEFQSTLRDGNKLVSKDPQELLQPLINSNDPKIKELINYLKQRYWN